MCRLLFVKSEQVFDIKPHLETFARICKNSKEYQGHGWGAKYMVNGKQLMYKNPNPIWEHNFEGFPKTTCLMVHARSAFRDEGITIENNMPFTDHRYSFIFNGELRGVKIKSEGRIGAEKIFNLIRRMDKGDMELAFNRGIRVIQKQTGYIRAMNMIISDMDSVYLCSLFNQETDYYTLHRRHYGNGFIVCSEKYPGESGWEAIPNNTIEVFS